MSVHQPPHASERAAFVRYLNRKLGDNPSLCRSHRLPLPEQVRTTESDHLASITGSLKDGILLCYLINASVPDTIDCSLLYVELKQNSPSSTFQILQNLEMALAGARKIGCQLVNISPEDLMAGRAYLVFGLLWQIIRAGLLYHINVGRHPELLDHLALSGVDLRNVPAEGLLMHWLNWHLKRAGYAKQVSNFGSDLADGLAYAHLMHSLSSTAMSRQSLEQVCRLDCGMERANRVLDATRLIDPVSAQFLQAEDLCAGREKLNLCFLASLFNSGTGMRPINDELKAVNDQLSGSLDAERNRARTLERNVSSMESRIRELELENKKLRGELDESNVRCRQLEADRQLSEREFKDAARKWLQSQETFEAEILRLNELYNSAEKELGQTKNDLVQERRQIESFGVCADTLTDELEQFRSRQEKMEFLIEHLKLERQRSDMHVSRLRQLFKSFPTVEQLAKNLFANDGSKLTFEAIVQSADKKAYVLKKAREGNNWRMRFVVIRDNFLFYFKSDSDLKAEPRGVIRLDDAQAYFSENPTRAQDSLKGSSFLCVESPNYGHQKENGDAKHGGKSLFYLSGTIGELQQWKEMVDKAAGWWTRKSSLNEMRRRASSAANAVSQPTVPKISAAAR